MKEHILFTYYILQQSWDSAIGIATGYGLDDQGVGVQVR
jgi:hypothetical protein